MAYWTRWFCGGIRVYIIRWRAWRASMTSIYMLSGSYDRFPAPDQSDYRSQSPRVLYNNETAYIPLSKMGWITRWLSLPDLISPWKIQSSRRLTDEKRRWAECSKRLEKITTSATTDQGRSNWRLLPYIPLRSPGRISIQWKQYPECHPGWH